jgi:predicted nicotinamide N-methyase
MFGPSPVGETVQILLNDAPLENQDYSSVGAQTWGGACVLAELIVEDPASFGMPEHSDKTTFRVLELGAGTGLVGLTVYKLLSAREVQTSLVLTDYYPSVLENLQRNAQANLLPNIPIDVARLDWETFPTMDAISIEGQLKGTFDLIVGADIVYEEDHAVWIKACLERLLRRPSTASLGAVFHLVIPLRATHTMESSTIEKVFALRHEDFPKFPDMVLGILHHEQIICDAHATACDSRFPDRADEVVYAHYKIGWVKSGHE